MTCHLYSTNGVCCKTFLLLFVDLEPQASRMWHTDKAFSLSTHFGRMTHICVGNLAIIGPINGLSPGRRQAIIWTNVGILLIEPLRTNFSEISIETHTFSFKEMHLKVSSGKFCLGLNVLTHWATLNTLFRIIIHTCHTYHPPISVSCHNHCLKTLYEWCLENHDCQMTLSTEFPWKMVIWL